MASAPTISPACAPAERIEPMWVSDHLCWTGIDGFHSHDLLPLPHTQEALGVVCADIDRAQTVLGRPLLIENPSSYVTFADPDCTEWTFMAEMARRTGREGLRIDTHDHPVPGGV